MSSKKQNYYPTHHSIHNDQHNNYDGSKRIDSKNQRKFSLSFLDIVAYILIPGPMILFYPLIVAMALQSNCAHYLNKIYLVSGCFLLNMFMLPVLIPLSIFIGSLFGFLLFPLIFIIYALIGISDRLCLGAPIKGYVDSIKTVVPKFNIENDDDEMTEEYFED